MGYATIMSGGPDGRYTIALDYGESTRTALIDALNALVAELTVRQAAAQLKVTQADALEATQRAQVAAAQEAFIVAASSVVPGGPRPSTAAIKAEMELLKRMQLAHEGLRRQLAAVKFDFKVAQTRLIYWTNFTPTETRNAWCVDLTEDASSGQTVATVDIPGESNLLLIAPGARGWNSGDGILTAREIMSPEQAFWNAAVLPGWQKFLPTYRWGTITALDIENDTADVDLFDAISSAQSLSVNQESSLAGVPIEYMTCNATCFSEGDNVVVQFDGQDWGSPRIIGFLDNPKRCGIWTARYCDYSGTQIWIGDSLPYYAPLTSVRFKLVSGADITASEFYNAAYTGTLTVEYQVDGGGWATAVREIFADTVWYSGVGAPADVSGQHLAVGFDVLSVEPLGGPLEGSFTFYADNTLYLNSAAVSGFVPEGSVIEVRAHLSGEMVFNGALKNGQGGEAGSAEVAFIGRIDLTTPSTSTLTRFEYTLAGP